MFCLEAGMRAVAAPALHIVFEHGRYAPLEILTFTDSGCGDDMVAVTYKSRHSADARKNIGVLRRKFAQLTYWRVLLEYNLTVGSGVYLQRVTVTDNIDIKNLVRLINVGSQQSDNN